MIFANYFTGNFFGVHHGQMADFLFFQYLPYLSRQMAYRCFINVCDFKHFRTKTVACSHGRNHRDMESVALTDDGNLCRHIINGINNEIGMKIFNK